MPKIQMDYYISIFLLFCICANINSQSNETTYFLDVTETHIPLDPEAHILDVILFDVDTDGDLDAVLALESDINRLYLNNGEGKFTWKKGVFGAGSHDTEHVQIADFNGDGTLDVIFVAEDDQYHEYYLGNGDATFQNVSDRLLGQSEGNGLDVGDVNGDGLPDIVIGNSGASGQNFLWINDKDKPGYFIDYTEQGLPHINDSSQSIKMADLDGDGDLDMVVGNEIPPNRLLLNDGRGTFKEVTNQLELPVPLHTREVFFLDAENDGDLDIIFANLTNNGGQWEKNPRTRLLLNDGYANFKDKTEEMPANTFSTYAGAPIDFDQDGDIDILMSAIKIPPFDPMQVHAYENDGKGNFSDMTQLIIPKETFGRSWDIAIGDVNGDGFDDALIGGWGSQLRLLLGKKLN